MVDGKRRRLPREAGGLERRLVLPREARLVNREVDRGDEAQVRGHAVAHGQDYNVTGHEGRRRNLDDCAVPHDAAERRREL